jgi:hypothetical protein
VGLVAAIEALDPADGAAVEAAAQAIASAAGRLDDVTAFLARAMGFGEATLVHLDLAGLERQVQASTAMLRQVDAAVVGRAVSALVGKLTPVFSLDLGTPVASGLDALLALLEEKAADIAAAVAGVELGAVTGPLTEGLGAVTGVIGQISDALGRVTQAVRTSLETVRTAVAAVPLDEVVGAIRGVLDVVTQALDAVRGVVDRVSGTLNDVAGTATTAIGLAEEAVDNFKKAVDDLLKQAADFVEELHLADAIGKIADQVNGFAQALGRVQMRPYFDQASEVIGTTADVVGALPLGLLPDSVKSDLDRAVAPIRAIDLPALETEVEGWFQIRDGKFALRAPLESALSEVQEKIRDLITAVESADPRQLIEPINNELGQIAGKIRELEPQLTLAPLAEAIDRVKGMLGSFDLRATLAPVTEVFDQILAAIDQYSPAALIQPLEERVDAIRTRVTQAIRLDDWLPRLDAMVAQGRGLLDRLDPTRLEPLITEGFNEARAQLARIDGFHPAAMLGEFVTSMLAGSGLKLHPWTFQAVIGWLTGDASGSSQLAARAGRIADAVDVTRAAVAGVDLGALAQELEARAVAVRAAVALRLPGGSPARLRLDRALGGLQPAAALGALAAHRLRYVGALEAAGALTAGVRAMGLSQVDASLRALVAAVSPARALGEMKDKLLAQLGLRGIEGGLRGVLEHVLAIASPARLSRILLPIFLSLRARITALVDAVLAPVREGITRFQEVVAAFDLSPLREGLQGVVDEVKDQVRLMSPVEILKPQIEAWEALQATLLAFDPLGPLLDVVNAFKAAAERVLGKLRGEELLAQPIRIYDEILEAVRALDVEELTRPVLDALDDLAGQIDEGLDGTVTALERLQQALPAPGAGGGSASASGSMGVS